MILNLLYLLPKVVLRISPFRVQTNPVFSYCSAVPPVLQVHHSSGCAPRSRVKVLLALFQVREVRVSSLELFWHVLELVVDCMD